MCDCCPDKRWCKHYEPYGYCKIGRIPPLRTDGSDEYFDDDNDFGFGITLPRRMLDARYVSAD